MPGETFEIVGWIIAAEIIHEEKWGKLGHLPVAEGAVEMNSCPLQRGLALPDFVDFSDLGLDIPLVGAGWFRQ